MRNNLDNLQLNKNLIREFLRSRINSAISYFGASSDLRHRGFKGGVREVFIRDLIAPLLSSDMGCGSGIIIDRTGNQSGQTDVVLYSKDVIPSIGFVENSGVYPVEACFYAIEVKSKITTEEIRKSVMSAQAIIGMNNLYHPLQIDQLNQQSFGPASTIPRSILFGFSSNRKSTPQKEFDRFRGIMDENSTNNNKILGPPIRAFCVIGLGYWFYTKMKFDGVDREGWFKIDATDGRDEVLALIGGIFNTISTTKHERQGLNFGYYLMSGNPIITA